jgi:hypothetical protein
MPGDLADRQAVARRLGHHHQHRDAEHQRGQQRKMRHAKEQRTRQREPWRRRDLSKARLANQCGQSGAGHQAQQHAEVGDHTAAKSLDADDQYNRCQSQSEMAKAAKVGRRRIASSQPPTGNRKQR